MGNFDPFFRRTSDLSVSALIELCKGQSGELGTARELQVEGKYRVSQKYHLLENDLFLP